MAKAQWETFKVEKVIFAVARHPEKVITYLHNCAKALQDWHMTWGVGWGSSVYSSNHKGHKNRGLLLKSMDYIIE